MDGNIESQYIIETGQQKLERLGMQEVMSSAAVNGAAMVIPVSYATSTYKMKERYGITQELPRDGGQGYQFTNTNQTEV